MPTTAHGTIEIRSPDRMLGDNLTRCHAATVRDLLEKIEEDGFFHTSTKDAPLFSADKKLIGYGGSHNLCFIDAAWGINELARLGYNAEARTCCEWYGRHLSHAPPRWVRWLNRDGSAPATGLYETEGHAAVLLGYASTLKHGSDDDAAFLKRFWGYYATGLRWLFQLSELSQYHHLLYDDGEPSGRVWGGGAYSIYSNTFAVTALGASRKAISLLPWPHDAHFAILQQTLEDDIFAYLRDQKRGMWLQARYSDGRIQDHLAHSFNEYLPFQHVMFQLSPLTLFSDNGGYWPTRDQDPRWLKTSENTFDSIYTITCEWLKAQHMPVFYAGNCYGTVPPAEFLGLTHATSIQFGHGVFTEAALLLDRMELFERALATIAKGVNNPHFGEKYQYVAPHLAFSGDSVHGYGDVGNLLNSAEYLKLVRLMAGIDDQRDSLTLMPRVPRGWSIRVTDMPVAIIKDRKARRGRVTYDLAAKDDGIHFRCTLTGAVEAMALRLGPWPADMPVGRLTVSPHVGFSLEQSGDGAWLYIPELKTQSVDLTIRVAS